MKKRLRAMKRRVIYSMLLTILILYSSIGYSMGLPLPALVTSESNSEAYAISQIILVLPVLVMGYGFYKKGFLALLRGKPDRYTLIAFGTGVAFCYGIYGVYHIFLGDVNYVQDSYLYVVSVTLTLSMWGNYLTGFIKGSTSMVDKVSRYALLAGVCLAFFAAFGWYLDEWDISFAIRIFLSVLIITCPCALELATAMSISIAQKKGEEYGICIKNGEVLEQVKELQMVVLDKTGTITEGKPVVTDILPLTHISKDKLLQFAASAQKGVEYPFGEAIMEAASPMEIELLDTDSVKVVPGQGIEAVLEGYNVILGNENFIKEKGLAEKESMEIFRSYALEGKTPIFVAVNGDMAGILCVADKVKESSVEAVKKLIAMGMEVVMLTGDNEITAKNIAGQAGIEKVFAARSPMQKVKQVGEFQNQGKRVLMIGDGENDLKAMAAADVSCIMLSNQNFNMENIDVILQNNDLRDAAAFITLGLKTGINIKQNLFWTFIYNAIGIPVAMGVLYMGGGRLLDTVTVLWIMCLSLISLGISSITLRKMKLGMFR